MASMRRRFTTPCSTSRPHMVVQVKDAAKGWVVERREAACSSLWQIAGKALHGVYGANVGAVAPAVLGHKVSRGHAKARSDRGCPRGSVMRDTVEPAPPRPGACQEPDGLLGEGAHPAGGAGMGSAGGCPAGKVVDHVTLGAIGATEPGQAPTGKGGPC
jgi:hypothetical protein